MEFAVPVIAMLIGLTVVIVVIIELAFSGRESTDLGAALIFTFVTIGGAVTAGLLLLYYIRG